jgi:hypothetical protein
MFLIAQCFDVDALFTSKGDGRAMSQLYAPSQLDFWIKN